MIQNISCCGTDCSACGISGSLCEGCNACEGKVFHAPKGKACPIYECAVLEKKLTDCSACTELPCAVWRSTRDPKYTDEEFENSINERIANLRQGKQQA